MLNGRPLYALILALLPAAVALSEVVRGTPTSSAWHPLGVVAFVYMLGAVVWYSRREVSTLYAISLFMFASLAMHPVLFAVLIGGWRIPFRLAVDPDLLYYSLSIALWIAVFMLLPKSPPRSQQYNLRFSFKPVDLLIFAIFASLTALILRLYLQQLGGIHPPMEIFGVTRAADPLIYFTIGAVFTIINALSEELWFRGLLLGALRDLLPMWPAILLQALCFGLSHWLGTPQGIYGLVLAGSWGIALGWWTYVRGSIWQALAVHLLADWLIFAYTNG